MLHDNHADYRNKQTRGVPRGGAALLHGIAWCGECGRELVECNTAIPVATGVTIGPTTRPAALSVSSDGPD